MTPPAGPWLTAEEARAWRSYQDMRHQLEAAVGAQLARESNLSVADYELLVPLSEVPDGQLRARDLGRGVGWEKSRLSHHITRMERRGLVERRECPSDARGAFVAITSAGREALEAAAPGHVATVRRLFIDVLSAGELDALERICRRVLERLQRDQAAACAEGQGAC